MQNFVSRFYAQHAIIKKACCAIFLRGAFFPKNLKDFFVEQNQIFWSKFNVRQIFQFHNLLAVIFRFHNERLRG